VTGNWMADFWSDENVHSPGIGMFKQVGNSVTGTFLKPSGDYRFLQGNVSGDSLFMSYFDGSYCMQIRVKVKGKEFTGNFYTGLAGKRNLKAKLDQHKINKAVKNIIDEITNKISKNDKKLQEIKTELKSIQIKLRDLTLRSDRLNTKKIENLKLKSELDDLINNISEQQRLLELYKYATAEKFSPLVIDMEEDSSKRFRKGLLEIISI
jgi:hypothetical protein